MLSASIFFAATKRERYRTSSVIRPINILFIGVVLASVIVFIPVYSEHGYRGGLLVTLLLSIHNMLRLFVIDGELSFLIDAAYGAPGRLFIPYSVPATVLYISAPMITFGIVLSFNKNAASARKYLSGYRKDMFVFSDLNEKSAALAESLRKTYPDGMLVFCGVRAGEDDSLSERAKNLKSICFSKDVTALRLNVHSKKAISECS